MAEGIGTYDIVVLGGGSGGYACALRAAELGKRVALIEKDKVGGTCLHRGCIPTKALLHAAEIADHARDSATVRRQDHLRGHRHPGRARLQGRRGRPALEGPAVHRSRAGRSTPSRDRGGWSRRHSVRVGDTIYEAGHIVLATGSEPRSLPGLDIDGERVITSDHALVLDRVPASVVILGGGVIGVEFASVWRSFGAEVTIVEMLPQLLPLEDESSAKLLQRAFRRRGIRFELGARFESRQAHRHRRHGHAGGRQDARRRPAAGRGRAAARSPPASATRRPAWRWSGASSRSTTFCRTSVPTISAVGDLDRHAAARARRLRRGHPGRRADRRARPSPRSTTTACRGSPTATRRSPRSASPPRRPASAASRSVEFNYNLGGNGKSVILQTQGAAKVIAIVRGGPPPAGARRAHRRQPGRRAHRRGPADLQLGRASPRTWPSSSTRTPPSPRRSARRTSRWPASPCTSHA